MITVAKKHICGYLIVVIRVCHIVVLRRITRSYVVIQMCQTSLIFCAQMKCTFLL